MSKSPRLPICELPPEAVVTAPAPADGERLTPGDDRLLRLLVDRDGAGIESLVEALGVTATAVRERLKRLLRSGLIRRRKLIEGRGRPAYVYLATAEGRRRSGADLSLLADVLLGVIVRIDDQKIRSRLVSEAAAELGERFAGQIRASDPGESLMNRLNRLSRLLAAHRISASAEGEDDPAVAGEADSAAAPVLRIAACPFPHLRDAANHRELCRLETEAFGRAVGKPMQLARCILDGAADCCFVPRSPES